MRQTKEGVRPYCTCNAGFTGNDCSTPVTCTNDKCGVTRVCNNEGRCVCEAGKTGDTCTTTTTCKEFKLFLKYSKERKPIAAADVKIIIAALGGVDAATLTVLTQFKELKKSLETLYGNTTSSSAHPLMLILPNLMTHSRTIWLLHLSLLLKILPLLEALLPLPFWLLWESPLLLCWLLCKLCE
jgi:hypothetical protein